MFNPKTFNDICACLLTQAEVEIDGNEVIVTAIENGDVSGHPSVFFLITRIVDTGAAGYLLHGPRLRFVPA